MPMKTNVNLNRRSFLKTSLAIGATYSLSPVSWSRVIGANDTIQAAVVGVNGRGGAHISELKSLPGVRVAALCDVDRRVLAAKTKGLDQVRTYQDVRELLENKDIDVVTIATTNHWHSLITIWACQAGKDVYV
jgi:predicted dehydrogenase